jgi:hypothetical protein
MERDWLIVTEQWRSVVGFPAYEVSDRGRVRRLTASSNAKAGQVLKPCRNRNGYYNVVLIRSGERFTRVVHSLVCDAFLGALPPGFHRSHLNGDRSDNRLANLQIETASDNNRRKRGHGTLPVGTKSGNAKLTEAQAESALRAVRSGASQSSIARKLGVCAATIQAIASGRSWPHLQEAK